MNQSNDGFEPEASTGVTAWEELQPAEFPEYRTGDLLKKIFTPCILVVGTLGNVATVCVMRRIKDRGSSQDALLMTLAVSDLLLLQTGMWYRLLWYFVHVDLRVWHPAVCKLYYWVLYSANTQSAWLVTGVTAQRAMSVLWPHRVRAVCTRRRTWLAVGSVLAIAGLAHAHFLLWREVVVDEFDGGKRCVAGTAGYFRFLRSWAWVDMFLSSFLPSLFQVVCDVVLCLALYRAADDSATIMPAATPGHHDTSDSNAKQQQHHHHHGRRKKTASKVTVLCLVLSGTFLTLTLPVCIEEVWYNSTYLTLTPREGAQRWLRKNVFTLMWYSNSAVNFFLYCVTGTKFRQEFVDWVSCRTRRPSSGSEVTAGVVEGRKK